MGHIFIQKFICDIVSEFPIVTNQEAFFNIQTIRSKI